MTMCDHNIPREGSCHDCCKQSLAKLRDLFHERGERLAECEADRLEQCRLNGMGGSREARLMARLAEVETALSVTEGLLLDRNFRLAEAERDAARWRWLREQCGYHQDGSETTVTLFQDDATRSAFIKIGSRTLGTDGSTLAGIIDAEITADSASGGE